MGKGATAVGHRRELSGMVEGTQEHASTGDDKVLVILYVPEGISEEEARKVVRAASPDRYAALMLPDATQQRIA